MNGNEISWIILRLVYAWVFLYPVSGLVKDWPGTVSATRLLVNRLPELFSGISGFVENHPIGLFVETLGLFAGFFRFGPRNTLMAPTGCHWWLVHQCESGSVNALVDKPPVPPKTSNAAGH